MTTCWGYTCDGIIWLKWYCDSETGIQAMMKQSCATAKESMQPTLSFG